MIKIVLDTNVFVSSFFGGNPRRIVDLWKTGEVTLCLSKAIIDEYVEVLRRLGLRRLEHHVLVNDWDGASWQSEQDLSSAPIFPDGVESDAVVAADYAPDGALWVGTAGGLLGTRSSRGIWLNVFTPVDSPLVPHERIFDIAVGADGTVWIGTDRGLLAYGAGQAPPPPETIYIPSAEKP